jgi:excisionase family DNA binding protein
MTAVVAERYFSPQEIATILKVSDETVRRFIRRGALPAIRIGPGGDYRVTEEALAEFLVPTR